MNSQRGEYGAADEVAAVREVLLVMWCERQDAVHFAVDIDNCHARNYFDTPLLEIDFTGMTTVVFRECDIHGPEVQTPVAGGSLLVLVQRSTVPYCS